MANAPSTDNYTLGKGIVYFDKKDATSGLYGGERDLGNAPAFTFNIAIEKLDHYSSRGGLKAKDKEIISQITPGVSFTLDEVNKENLALLTLANLNVVTQVAGVATAEAVMAHLDLRSDLMYRDIGLTTLSHGTVTGGPFEVGETVTGATSSATGIVAFVDAAYIMVATSGTFVDTDALTGGTSSAAATMDADPVWVPGVLLVQDDADTATYVADTDYSLTVSQKDPDIGRIQFLSGGTITEGETVHVTYGYRATEYTQVQAFAQTQIEGKLRFVSDNPAGTQQELEVWRCSLTPAGDTAMIGDDWSTLGFAGEILKDETGHPDSPYMNITMA